MKHPTWNKERSEYEIDGVHFNGHHIEWKLEYSPETYLKESELSGDEWRKGGYVRIYMNNDCVLEEFCRTPERAMLLLAKGLHELQCFFELYGIPDLKTWKEDLVGKKVHHGGIPSTVECYSGEGEVILLRDDGKPYQPDLYPSLVSDDPDEDEWKERDRVHITDSRINWHITPSN